MRDKLKIRYVVLIVLLSVVWATQLIPILGEVYAQSVYPVISHFLSSFSKLMPFAIGDLFIFLSVLGLLFNPIRARYIQKKKWKQILLNEMEYLLWIYAWFYLAWGLNYSQKDFYGRTNIPYTAYTPEIFQSFVDNYIDKLNLPIQMSPPLTNHWSAGKAYTDTTKSAIRWGYIALPTPLRA